MITAEEINKLFKQYFQNADSRNFEKLNLYYRLIEEENQKYNLTGFYDEKLYKFGIIENILIFQEIELRFFNLDNLNILDIGAGAGFPSLPYFIFSSEKFHLTIYEAQKKRCDFLNLVIKTLNLKNIEILNIRAEDSKQFEKFDFITARAVSELKNLIEISHKLGKINSLFCFLKSKNYLSEIENANWIISKLKLTINPIQIQKHFEIDNVLVTFSKTKKTPNDIPRQWKTIIKNNLNK